MELFDCRLPVNVQFDEETAGWRVDGLPVLLVPRHFWVYIQRAMEQGLGVDGARKLVRDVSYEAALTWCAHQAQLFGLTGANLFAHYMRSGSKRGYGKMTPELIDIDGGRARVQVDNSIYVAEMGTNAGRNVCYMFEGAFAGGLAGASRTVGLDTEWTGDEMQCAANGASTCIFEMRRVR